MQQAITEKIISAISFLLTVGISWMGIVKGIQVWAQERSIGKKALGEVITKLDAIRIDTDSVKRKVEATDNENEELKRSVRRLDEHVSELIQSMFKFMQGKSR